MDDGKRCIYVSLSGLRHRTTRSQSESINWPVDAPTPSVSMIWFPVSRCSGIRILRCRFQPQVYASRLHIAEVSSVLYSAGDAVPARAAPPTLAPHVRLPRRLYLNASSRYIEITRFYGLLPPNCQVSVAELNDRIKHRPLKPPLYCSFRP